MGEIKTEIMRNRVLVNALNVDWQHSVIFDLQTTSFLCMHTFHVRLYKYHIWQKNIGLGQSVLFVYIRSQTLISLYSGLD